MKLNHLGLMAFAQAAKTLNMTRAAAQLAITQSALSQRIQSLEDDLEIALFTREGRNIQITEAGHRVLRFCESALALEGELVEELRSNSTDLAGPVRIAGFSSVMRSVVIPSLGSFLRKHPKLTPDFQSYEVIELPEVLRTGRADFVILDYELNRSGVEQIVLGLEEYVVIEPRGIKNIPEVFLDHGPHDNATDSFFAEQARAPKVIRRSFMGDVYGIIEGVQIGLGRAVMSKHLIEDTKGITIVGGYKRFTRKVTLHHFTRPFYSRTFTQTRDALTEEARKYLAQK